MRAYASMLCGVVLAATAPLGAGDPVSPPTLRELAERVGRESATVVLLDGRLDRDAPAVLPPPELSAVERLERLAVAADAFVVTVDAAAFLIAPDTPEARAGYREWLVRLDGPVPEAVLPVMFHFRETRLAKIAEALGKATGVRFIFDDRVAVDAPVTLEVARREFGDTLRILMLQTGLVHTMIDDSTLMISPAEIEGIAPTLWSSRRR